MATRLFVERGLDLRAAISKSDLRIVSPQFREARVAVSRTSYAAVPTFQSLQIAAGYRNLAAATYYVRPFMRDVILDPDTKNLYLRDPTANVVSFSDTQALTITKAVSGLDSVSFAVDAPSFDFTKGVTDTVWVEEEISILLSILRAFEDSVSFAADSSSITVAKNPTDSVSLSEASSFTYEKPLADQVGISQTRIVLRHAKPFSDGVAVTEAFEKVVEFSRGFDEGVSLADTNTAVFGKVNTEDITVSEASAISFSRPESEDIAISEAFSRVAVFNREFADTFVLDDLAEVDSFVKDALLNKTNVFGLQETHAFTMAKGFADSMAVADLPTLSVGKEDSHFLIYRESNDISKRSRASSGFNASSLNTAQLNN